MDHRNRWFNPFKMVIVHSFFYVYQKVTKMACWSACTLGAWHIAPTCGHKRGEGHWIQRRGGLREENMTETMVLPWKNATMSASDQFFLFPLCTCGIEGLLVLDASTSLRPSCQLKAAKQKPKPEYGCTWPKKWGVPKSWGYPQFS